MKKIIRIISVVTAALMIMSGCEKIEDKPTVNENGLNDASSGEEAETQPELEERDRTIDTDKEFVIDDAKLLSDSDYSALNEHTAWLAHAFKINAAVVTTDDLGDKNVQEYAESYYEKLYSSSNGIMLLINNDTGEDFFLRKGAPSLFITDSDVELLFSEISPLLVTENYKEAADRVLDAAELSLPEFAADRTNKMTKEEITEVNNILSEVNSDSESLSMIFIGDIGEKKISDYAKEQADKYLEGGLNHAIMVVNVQTGEYYISAKGSLSSLEEKQSGIKESISGCLSTSDGKKIFDYRSAADIFSKFSP